MVPPITPQLLTLLEKFYEIGRAKYNGHIYDNVLNIFDELSQEEQRALLRGTLKAYAAWTAPISNERELIDTGDAGALLVHIKKSKQSQSDADTGDKADAIPDVWFVRFFITVLLGFAAFIAVHVIMLAADSDPASLLKAKVYFNLFGLFIPS